MGKLFTPDQYADLAISKIEAAHHAKTGEFLHFGKYRDVLIEQFRAAITSALEQAVTTVRAANVKDVDPVPHIEKHLPS